MSGLPAPNPETCFQNLILKLQSFWASHGCVLLQPHDQEVGAGTFHPATTLRALGPKPWKAAYVQPSRRPTDGRYGENPNRLQHYYQFQAMIKPSPPNSQELYLESLKALGIDSSKHDIRFVEDDWESPTLGAWGDRKSTRLNSSHRCISYAVFCLKKTKQKNSMLNFRTKKSQTVCTSITQSNLHHETTTISVCS